MDLLSFQEGAVDGQVSIEDAEELIMEAIRRTGKTARGVWGIEPDYPFPNGPPMGWVETGDCQCALGCFLKQSGPPVGPPARRGSSSTGAFFEAAWRLGWTEAETKSFVMGFDGAPMGEEGPHKELGRRIYRRALSEGLVVPE
jgi:hypothetical protein